MRLDKYLKVARIMKRRTVAHDASAGQKILVNERVAKPATAVASGDLIRINYGNRSVLVKVLATPEHPKAADGELYEIIEEKETA